MDFLSPDIWPVCIYTSLWYSDLQYYSLFGVKSSLFIESYSSLVDHNKGKNTHLHLEIQVYNSSAYVPMRMVKNTRDWKDQIGGYKSQEFTRFLFIKSYKLRGDPNVPLTSRGMH